MQNLPTEFRASPDFTSTTAQDIYTSAMTRLYVWMMTGLALTTVIAFLAYGMGIGLVGFIIGLVLWIGILFVMNRVADSAPPAVLLGLYLVFTAVGGVMLSGIAAYKIDTLLFALAITGGVFVAMSAIGLTTKRDLTAWGPILGFTLVGLVIVMIVNIFIGSGILSWIVTLLLLPVFLALTVYETKQVKELAEQAASEGDRDAASRISIMGAVGLYLSFINIFMIVLRIYDFFSGDD